MARLPCPAWQNYQKIPRSSTHQGLVSVLELKRSIQSASCCLVVIQKAAISELRAPSFLLGGLVYTDENKEKPLTMIRLRSSTGVVLLTLGVHNQARGENVHHTIGQIVFFETKTTASSF